MTKEEIRNRVVEMASGSPLIYIKRGATFDKKINSKYLNLLFKYGRGDRDRTCDLMVPNHARYQLRYTSK